MAILVHKVGNKVDLRFHATPKNFKRVEKFNYQGHYYLLHINKNDAVYDIKRSIRTGKEYFLERDEIFNKIYGRPSKIAKKIIMAEIDVELLK